MAFDYLPGEMDAWSEFFKSGKDRCKFALRCSRKHVIESPIDLTREQVDQRCTECEKIKTRKG